MPVGKVIADERIADDRDKAALERGPIVYCVEERDADLPLDSIALGNKWAHGVERAGSSWAGL